jgi:quinol monooxygenase YgiN
MYCSIRQYRTKPDQLEEILQLLDEDLAERISAEPGFIQYHVIAGEDGEACTVTLFDSEEGASRSAELAAQFTREKLTGFDVSPAGSLAGPVRVSRARHQTLEPVRPGVGSLAASGKFLGPSTS